MIKLRQSEEEGATPALLVLDAIRLGAEYRRVTETAQFYKRLLVDRIIADTIRECSSVLGMGGVFKNGCLYRESGLPELWKKSDDVSVVCDHSVPVTELVRQHVKELKPIEELIFSPVVRITKESNDKLIKLGFAKEGYLVGYPLFRYSHIGMMITTHTGEAVDPRTWTDANHWQLIRDTEELKPVLQALKLS